jgi:hypothetical protein
MKEISHFDGTEMLVMYGLASSKLIELWYWKIACEN